MNARAPAHVTSVDARVQDRKDFFENGRRRAANLSDAARFEIKRLHLLGHHDAADRLAIGDRDVEGVTASRVCDRAYDAECTPTSTTPPGPPGDPIRTRQVGSLRGSP